MLVFVFAGYFDSLFSHLSIFLTCMTVFTFNQRISRWQFLSTVMSRPKNSSYRSYQLIHDRLLKEPLWLGDWRSTGLKSRSTVHNRLKYLVSMKLISKNRDKHKILYSLVNDSKESDIAMHMRWLGVLRKSSRKETRKAAHELGLLLTSIDEASTQVTKYGEIFVKRGVLIRDSKELLTVLQQIGVDVTQLPVSPDSEWWRKILLPYLYGQLCLLCLRQGKISYYISDFQTGESICPIDGTVQQDT